MFWLMLLAAQIADGAAPAPKEPVCGLMTADLAANAKLSFEAFDQQGTTPATARQLGERGCYREAARATEHYLLHGPELTAGQENVVVWHLGQYLAAAGDEDAAASVIASTKAPDGDSDLDWNSYVDGTWAFLRKDKALLEQSFARLRAAPPVNARNAAVLERLLRCFNKSYTEVQFGDTCM